MKVATLEEAPDAAPPQCRHFGPCGGCSLQGLQYAAQLAAKQVPFASAFLATRGVLEMPLQ